MKRIFDIDDHARLPWRFFKVLQSTRHHNQER
jgi:hypothetical protein